MSEHNSDEEEDEEKTIKLVLFGDSRCGKSTICFKLSQHKFINKYVQTSGVDFYSKRLVLAEKTNALVQLWDVGGHNIASSTMLSTYLFGAQAVLFVYDVTNLKSFENISNWISTIKKIVQKMNISVIMCLVGNKTDLEHKRVISIQKNDRNAIQNGLDPFYVSAKTGDNLELMFRSVCAKILNIKLTKAEQECNINVVKAPIIDDSLGQSYISYSYYRKIPSTQKSIAQKNSDLETLKEKEKGEKNNDKSEGLLQKKPPPQIRNSAICSIS